MKKNLSTRFLKDEKNFEIKKQKLVSFEECVLYVEDILKNEFIGTYENGLLTLKNETYKIKFSK